MKPNKQTIPVRFNPAVEMSFLLKDHSYTRKRRMKARQEACQVGLLASMEDAFNKIPVRATA